MILLSILGLLIFVLIGSPFVRGCCAKIQAEANQLVIGRTAEMPDLPGGANMPAGVHTLVGS
ncbi:MAG TPA: hypothetical protein VF241_07775 [Propionibacteriaceae bacterium]